MLQLLGAAPIGPATAYLMAHPHAPSHLGWASAHEPHTRGDALQRELAAVGLSKAPCPDCGAEMRAEAIRTMMTTPGLNGLGFVLDCEHCCHFCTRFVLRSCLFAGLVLACGFAAAEALARLSGQPAPARDRWPAETDESLTEEYARRGSGWSGGGTRRTWTLAGPVVVAVTMGDWQSEGGRTYGEDLSGTITLPDGSRSVIDGERKPSRARHYMPDWADRAEDELTRAIDEMVARHA